MCKCTHTIRTPFCERGDCVWPYQKHEALKEKLAEKDAEIASLRSEVAELKIRQITKENEQWILMSQENHKLKLELSDMEERKQCFAELFGQERSERIALETKLTNEYAKASRLIEWINDPKRKPANLEFTDGPERQVAYAVEVQAASLKEESHYALRAIAYYQEDNDRITKETNDLIRLLATERDAFGKRETELMSENLRWKEAAEAKDGYSARSNHPKKEGAGA